jgi:hypothetical protein
MSHNDFNFGESCTYIVPGKANAKINEVRVGEKVKVTYQEVQGVLIADRVEQLPMQFEGRIAEIDAGKHTLTLHRPGLDKDLQIAGDCKVMLLGSRDGSLNDIRPGDHVTVTYVIPDGTPTVEEIKQTGVEFTGTLTAIDVGERTLKASSTFETKKFNLADNCNIVINGRGNCELSDLKLNEKLTLNYDEINGVNVVSRIGVTDTETNNVALTRPTAD